MWRIELQSNFHADSDSCPLGDEQRELDCEKGTGPVNVDDGRECGIGMKETVKIILFSLVQRTGIIVDKGIAGGVSCRRGSSTARSSFASSGDDE